MFPTRDRKQGDEREREKGKGREKRHGQGEGAGLMQWAVAPARSTWLDREEGITGWPGRIWIAPEEGVTCSSASFGLVGRPRRRWRLWLVRW